MEEMFLTGKPQYPVERTLLISGALEALLEARYRGHGPLLRACLHTQSPKSSESPPGRSGGDSLCPRLAFFIESPLANLP